MMWNYAEFPDGTCIAYSDLRDDGTIKITVERPREGGFDEAHCVIDRKSTRLNSSHRL